MSDYLTNLLARTQHPERTLQPRVLSIFDPVSPASMGEEVSGWDSREEPYQPAQVNQPVSRRDLSARKSSEVTGQDREDGGLLYEFDTRPREQASIPTPDGVRLAASSETASVATPSVLSSLASDQRGAPSRNPSDDRAINLSPIDPSVVADSSSRAGVRSAQEKPASWSRSPAQSESSTFSVPNEGMNEAARGERASLRREPSSQSLDIPSVVPTTQAHAQELNSRTNTRAGRGSALSSQQPLLGAATARSDGEQHHRFRGTVSEVRGRLPELRKEAAADGHNVSELSLDPSLVLPASVTKVSGTSHQPGDAQGVFRASEKRQEPKASPLAVPMASKNFLAVRRSASPMTASSVSQRLAADRGKPVEPVVQVTIGRVEVRAVAPPVRQQKNPKPQSAMSLDDYLKQRGGRSGG